MKTELAYNFLGLCFVLFCFFENHTVLPTKKIKHAHLCAHIHSRSGRFRSELQRDSQRPCRPGCNPCFVFDFVFTFVAISFPYLHTAHLHLNRTLTAVNASFSLSESRLCQGNVLDPVINKPRTHKNTKPQRHN